jgi:hypothetical protein
VNLAKEKNLSFSDRYKNKVNIVPLKYLYRLRGCVRPLKVVPRKNICFVLLARPCFRYSCVHYFCTIFVIHQKNWHRYHPLVISKYKVQSNITVNNTLQIYLLAIMSCIDELSNRDKSSAEATMNSTFPKEK